MKKLTHSNMHTRMHTHCIDWHRCKEEREGGEEASGRREEGWKGVREKGEGKGKEMGDG